MTWNEVFHSRKVRVIHNTYLAPMVEQLNKRNLVFLSLHKSWPGLRYSLFYSLKFDMVKQGLMSWDNPLLRPLKGHSEGLG